MSTVETNALGQPVGPVVANWQPPPWPPKVPMMGRFCRLEPLDVEQHAQALYEANSLDRDQRMWTYMAYGPFDTLESYRQWINTAGSGQDPLVFTIVDLALGRPTGIASYMRIDPSGGSIEVGGLAYSPLLQRTPAATEAMFLMMRNAFELGYRRYEWKCNALNAPSLAAARRLGFQFEGVFRNHVVHKGRNRDTAWLSIIDEEWPVLRRAYEQWLTPGNFDGDGQQKRRLSALMLAAREQLAQAT